MKLYDCHIAPNPRRVRIFLAEKGVEIERVELNIAEGDNLKPDFLAINPRGLLPTIVLDDGTVLDEVVAISRWIEETYPDPPLMGTNARDRAFIESRNRHMEIDGFMSVAEIFRNSHPSFSDRGLPGVSAVPAIPQLVDRGRAGIARWFERLNSYLGQHQFVAGNEFSIADITALSVVDFAGWVEEKVPPHHENTHRWYEAVSKRPVRRPKFRAPILGNPLKQQMLVIEPQFLLVRPTSAGPQGYIRPTSHSDVAKYSDLKISRSQQGRMSRLSGESRLKCWRTLRLPGKYRGGGFNNVVH